VALINDRRQYCRHLINICTSLHYQTVFQLGDILYTVAVHLVVVVLVVVMVVVVLVVVVVVYLNDITATIKRQTK